MKRKKTFSIVLLIILILAAALFAYIKDKDTITRGNSTISGQTLSLIKENPVYIFDGMILQKVGEVAVNMIPEEQFEVNIISNSGSALERGKVIITIPISLGLEVDKYSHRFIAIYDPQNKWYDTTFFQNPYHFNAKVIEKIGNKKLGDVSVTQYKVKADANEYTSRQINGDVVLNSLDSNAHLENGKEYSFFAIKDNVNIIILNVSIPMMLDAHY